LIPQLHDFEGTKVRIIFSHTFHPGVHVLTPIAPLSTKVKRGVNIQYIRLFPLFASAERGNRRG
jgi:hypothetical protein